MTYPEQAYKMMISIPDDVIARSASYAEPPVKAQ